MKQKWEKLWGQMEKTQLEIAVFLENSGLSSLALNKSKAFVKEFDNYQKMAAEFDDYISPADPLEIVFPFKTTEANEMWQRWKDYLSEQHGQLMRTRSEKSALEHITLLSNGDEAKTVKYLRYAMANRYKNFFAIEDKDTRQPPKDDTGSGFG